MHVTVETTNPDQLSALNPFLQFCEAYKGHFNKSYTHGAEHIPADNKHIQNVLDGLRAINGNRGNPFLIGSGSSHVYISTKDGAKPDDRLVLVTDN